jgi:hypothetical protein
MQKKLTLSPEHLRVDSFSTHNLPAELEMMQAPVVTTRPLRTCPECANTGPYATCE